MLPLCSFSNIPSFQQTIYEIKSIPQALRWLSTEGTMPKNACLPMYICACGLTVTITEGPRSRVAVIYGAKAKNVNIQQQEVKSQRRKKPPKHLSIFWLRKAALKFLNPSIRLLVNYVKRTIR